MTSAMPLSIGQVIMCFSLLQAAYGARSWVETSANNAGGVTFLLRESAFKVSQAHAERLCTHSVVENGSDVLGATQDGDSFWASPKQVADVLAASDDNVKALLNTLFGDQHASNQFDVKALCKTAVMHIPRILGIAAPSKPSLGCVDDECTQANLDVSVETLAHSKLSTVPQNLEADVRKSRDLHPIEPDRPEELGQDLFRGALNVIFGIFPAVDEQDDGADSSLLQEQSASGDPENHRIAFGPKILPQRHEQYRAYALKASAWVAAALRRIKSGRAVVKKWFILKSEADIDSQIIESRKHLMKVLSGLSRLKIVKGQDCQVSDKGGEVAFVMAAIFCNVQSANKCADANGYTANKCSCGYKQDGRHVINICEFYWDEGFGESTRVGTLVHEGSHLFGTVDKGYCDTVDCLSLSSANARRNADSYRELVQELVTMSRLQEEHLSSDYIPHEACNTLCNPTHYKGPHGVWRIKYRLPIGSCGQCKEVPHAQFKSLRLWGRDCGDGYAKAKSGTAHQLCCKSFTCKAITTTTTTGLCPDSSRQYLHYNVCKCLSDLVCSEDGRHVGCGYENDGMFDPTCSTCACHSAIYSA